MPIEIGIEWNKSGASAVQPRSFKSAVIRALRKAGSTALRDMRGEASKRIRARKKLAPKYITRALSVRRFGGNDPNTMRWALEVSGEPIPLIAYPHRLVRGKTGRRGIGPRARGGVRVEVNPGKSTVVRGAFIATMRSGHEGIFRRRGPERLPIDELLGSRPVDALLHEGEADAIKARGMRSFAATYVRVLPLELGKLAK